MVDHLQKNFKGIDDVALACVYFNHKEAVTPTDIIGNLLKQLLERNSNISDEARALYSAHEKRQSRPNLKELLQLLRTEANRISTVFMVLDALDEFSDAEKARATILLDLSQISTVRVMITGRPHMEYTVLSKLDEVSTKLIRASDNDIRKYLDTQIEKSGFLCEKLKADQSLRATVIEGILRKADGMLASHWKVNSNNVRFLVATLHLELLEDQPNEHCILSALNQLPKDVDEIYKATVSRIKSQEKPEHVEIAVRTLKWLTFAKERLQGEALLHALAVKEDSTDIKESDLQNTEKVISLCMGLVVLDRRSSEIRLVHETTQQYFQNYFGDGGVENVYAEIVMTCLRYFSFPAFSHPFADSKSLRAHLQKYKLSSYASRFWSVHIREGQLEKKLFQAIVKTFENQGTRDSVCQIREYTDREHKVLWELRPGVQSLHFASMNGLCLLCRELLRQSTMQRSYILVRNH